MSALYVGHIPASALPHFPDDGEPMHPEGLDVKLDVWDDGTHEVAVRDMVTRRWLMPVALVREVAEERTPSLLDHLNTAIEAARAEREAGQS